MSVWAVDMYSVLIGKGEVAFVWFFTLLILFALTALGGGGYYDWHDQQRLGQLVFLLGMLPMIFFSTHIKISASTFVSVCLLFFFGLLSSMQAEWPLWALKEWSHYMGLLLISLVLGGLIRSESAQFLVFGCMVVVGAVQAFRFLVFYLSAFLSGLEVLEADILYSGFSNPRFLGQFQIFLLPVMAFLIQCFSGAGKVKLAVSVMVVMSVHWCIAIMLGGRGVWFGVLLSHVLLLIVAPKFWRLVLNQVVAAVAGLCLFGLLFEIIPRWLEVTPLVYDGLRTDLSSREIIWSLAWNMFFDNPWFGVGPMHFAAEYNSIAAHPHQVMLQWLAEWGALATGVAIWLAVHGFFSWIRVLRSSHSTTVDASLWVALVGALLLAQVDGVFVMPYTETWFAVLAGVALSRWGPTSLATISQGYLLKIMVIPLISLFALIIFKEAASLPQVERDYLRSTHVQSSPRFWMQGWIPM